MTGPGTKSHWDKTGTWMFAMGDGQFSVKHLLTNDCPRLSLHKGQLSRILSFLQGHLAELND